MSAAPDAGLSSRLVAWLLPEPSVPADAGLPYWRERVLSALLLALVLLAVVAYVPSMVAAVAAGYDLIAAADTVALVWLLAIFFARERSLAWRSWNLLGLGYLLGLVLVVVVGPFGAGFVWLFAFAALAAVLAGRRGGALALALASATLVGAALVGIERLPWADRVDQPLVVWIVLGANFVLVGAAVVASVGTVVRGLEDSLARQRAARAALEEQVARREVAERERERLEAQVRRASKLEALGTLAGGIAHDMNNLLQPIMGFGEALRDTPGLPDPARVQAERVVEAAGRARDLVGQILTFGRQVQPVLEVVDLAAVAREVDGLLRASLGADIDLHVDLQAGLSDDRDAASLTVLGDRGQLHQVLVNLCTNAAQATGDRRGRITVELGAVEPVPRGDLNEVVHPPSTHAGAPLVWLSVTDQGAGIEQQTMERLFDPFFTTRSAAGGTGLGLAIVHGIVSRLGGGIHVSSSPGAGTRFTLALPWADPAGAVTPASPALVARGARGAGGAVLVVDDEPLITELQEGVLRGAGYRVTTANSAAAALELVRARPDGFDLVVTDQLMPGMSGLQLAASMSALRPGLPIVIASGGAATHDRAELLAVGVRGLLTKPFRAEELLEAVGDALAFRR